MNKKQFIEYIKPKLEEYNVSLSLESDYVLEGNMGGFFDESARKLAVAIKSKHSFGVLIHEYAHFQQWVKKPAFWDKVNPGHGEFFTWLESDKPVNRKVIKWKEDAMTLEHDCEARAMKIIDTLGLELDKKIYAQKANAYLLSYHLILTYRKWPDGSTYGDKISCLFPTKLLSLNKIKNTNSLKGDALALMTKTFR